MYKSLFYLYRYNIIYTLLLVTAVQLLSILESFLNLHSGFRENKIFSITIIGDSKARAQIAPMK